MQSWNKRFLSCVFHRRCVDVTICAVKNNALTHAIAFFRLIFHAASIYPLPYLITQRVLNHLRQVASCCAAHHNLVFLRALKTHKIIPKSTLWKWGKHQICVERQLLMGRHSLTCWSDTGHLCESKNTRKEEFNVFCSLNENSSVFHVEFSGQDC